MVDFRVTETEESAQRSPVRRDIRGIIFDMDGLLIDSEVYWEDSRRDYCRSRGCEWTPDDELDAKGMNSPEWAALIQQRCSFPGPREDIIKGAAARMRDRYERDLPLLPGALRVVRECASHYPLAIASSSPPEIIDFVMTKASLRDCFKAVVSADTVGRGKPAPDVFLVAARALSIEPEQAAVFEDSTNGIKAGLAAGMMVIAVPNPHYPPDAHVLTHADVVLTSLLEFQPDLFAAGSRERRAGDGAGTGEPGVNPP
jgi:HAD superfamily hydrolase (TIGR01509 family)